MARFNLFRKERNKTTNQAGGEAFRQSPQLELVSLLLTSFADDKFYQKADDTFKRLNTLIAQNDKEFAAKAVIYARTKFGMRSISHVAASQLAAYLSGVAWAKDFYKTVVYRPDDMSEILAYYTAHNSKIPNAMKKGFAAAFDKFDTYQLAKYRTDNRDFKLVDIVNLVHPVPTDRNAAALNALVNNTLRSAGTWEAALTKAGQDAQTEDEKADFKKDAWTELIRDRKIGYFALLRNLRNIITQAPDVLNDALLMLTDEKLIRNSLVLPFRYATAYDELMKMNGGKDVRNGMAALSKAVDISLKNVPKFDGDTLVVLDVSGSMQGRPSQIGALFSAVLVKSNNADFMTFSDNAKYRNVNLMDSTLTVAQSIRFSNGGTNFHAVFNTANRKYDRIVLLSDMQGWIGQYAPTQAFATYKVRTGANPFVYSFDLNGYGNMQFPENKVFCLAGFSDKLLGIMPLLETDGKALVNEINSINFN